ncbi:hypothetical protein RP20_CCG015572 [Aedes albopictus]|nr:hypothetical protein RP20_CCG015572 [Aedes albopictus]
MLPLQPEVCDQKKKSHFYKIHQEKISKNLAYFQHQVKDATFLKGHTVSPEVSPHSGLKKL